MKLPKILLIAFVFNLSFCGCDYLYRVLDKEGAEEKELVGDVLPFERNPTIEEIQVLLKIYGYNPGKIDGIWGVRTRNAIEKFQKDNGLKQTRFADQETWQKLSVFLQNGLIEENKLNVAGIQALLQKAGFDPGVVDGKMGPKTKAAILAFQEQFGLKVDGKIGYKTLTMLSEFLQDQTSQQ